MALAGLSSDFQYGIYIVDSLSEATLVLTKTNPSYSLAPLAGAQNSAPFDKY